MMFCFWVCIVESVYPDNWEDLIKRLDEGKALHGYQYLNDYLAIRNWAKNDMDKERDQAFKELMEENAFNLM